MLKVKVCGMRHRDNIQTVSKACPDFLGFIFYPGSRRFVGTDPDETIFREVAPGILKVGVFVDEKPEDLLRKVRRYRLDLAQLHGSESPDCCRIIREAGTTVIKAFGMVSGFGFDRLIPYLPVCDYFLWDTQSDLHGGSGLRFGWDELQRYPFEVPYFLSGGIGPEDTGAILALQHRALFAVDINSRFETAPGLKDAEQITTFIQAIKSV